MKRRFLLAARLVLAALAASGCAGQATPSSSAPSASATGPSAAVSPSCTPIGATAATPCSQQQYDQLQQRRADYAEAERVYRAFFEEDAKLAMSGMLPGDTVLEMLGGPMLSSYPQSRAKQHDLGITSKGPYTLVFVRPDGELQDAEAVAALKSCVDGRNAIGMQGMKTLGPGTLAEVRTTYRRVDGVLKLWTQNVSKVSSC